MTDTAPHANENTGAAGDAAAPGKDLHINIKVKA